MSVEEGCQVDKSANRLINVDMPSDHEATAIARLAYAFSDPLRVRIIAILRKNRSVCNCDFQSQLELSQSKASYHLKILIDAGLITREVRGTWSYCSLVDDNIVERLWKIWRQGALRLAIKEEE